MEVLGRRLDQCVALGTERDDGDRIPVSGVPCLAPRAFCLSVLVEHMASLQDDAGFPGMSLRGTDAANGTVAMAMVVPLHERTRPFSGLIEVREAPRRELRPVLCGTALLQSVVVTDARTGVGGREAQPMHLDRRRDCLEHRAVIPVQHGLVVQRMQVLGEGSHCSIFSSDGAS